MESQCPCSRFCSLWDSGSWQSLSTGVLYRCRAHACAGLYVHTVVCFTEHHRLGKLHVAASVGDCSVVFVSFTAVGSSSWNDGPFSCPVVAPAGADGGAGRAASHCRAAALCQRRGGGGVGESAEGTGAGSSVLPGSSRTSNQDTAALLTSDSAVNGGRGRDKQF